MKTKKLLYVLSLLIVCLFTVSVSAQLSSVNVYQFSEEPTVDGDYDASWTNFPVQTVNQLDTVGVVEPILTRTADADYGVTYQMGWKNNKLYVFFKVIDDVRVFDASLTNYELDYVSLILNMNEDHATGAAYSNSLPTWYVRPNIPADGEPAAVSGRGGPSNETTGWGWPNGKANFPAMEIATKEVTGGYNVEVAIDFTDPNWLYTGTLADGISFGLDVEGNDVDEYPTRKYQLFWSNTGIGKKSWDNLSGLGSAIIKAADAPNAVAQIDVNAPIVYFNNGILHFNNLENVTNISLSSITGQTIKSSYINEKSNYSVSDLKSGVYFVTFKGEKTSTQKVVIQ